MSNRPVVLNLRSRWISTAVTEDTHSTAIRGIAFDFSLKSATRGRDLPFFEVLHEANLDPARDTGTYFTARDGSLYPKDR